MGYLHGVKPKMTGGLDQSNVGISPEAHKEWKDKEGKHTIDAGVKEAPVALKGRELDTRKKNENVDKKSNQIAAGSHVEPAHRMKMSGKGMGAEDTKLKKAVGKPKGKSGTGYAST